MGICSSCYSGNNTTNASTVKLVLLDGQLKQYSSPVKVFMVAPPLNSFICNADEMDFDNYVTAMTGEEELRPGQLYFELPANWLNRRLTTEDMASLAVKAGSALMVSGGKVISCGCWAKRVDSLAFYDGDGDDGGWSMVGGGGDCVGNHSHGGGGRRAGGAKRRLFRRLERIEE